MYKEYLKRLVFDEINRRKMSKKILADKLGITMPTYYKYEKKLDLPFSVLAEILNELGHEIMIIPKEYIR